MVGLGCSVSKKVSIINPAPGGQSFTSLNSAKRYVRRGDAYWEVHMRSICFLSTIHTESVKRSAIETLALTTRRAYDSTVRDGKVLTQREAAAIPLVGNIRRMGLPG